MQSTGAAAVEHVAVLLQLGSRHFNGFQASSHAFTIILLSRLLLLFYSGFTKPFKTSQSGKEGLLLLPHPYRDAEGRYVVFCQ